MLGERGAPGVTQSAWIKSLMATLVRPWLGRGSNVGGLFGSRLKEGDEVLGWSRSQQAAFLIYSWLQLYEAIKDCNAGWAKDLRNEAARQSRNIEDPEFYGPFSLIVTDQGVRGYLHILNDLCFVTATKLDLRSWRVDRGSGAASDASAVTLAIKSLEKHVVASFIKKIAKGLATFDWRTSAAPDLSEEERRNKLVFRGSSGYKEIRVQLLDHLKDQSSDVGRAAQALRKIL
jgi:hypothetical protein